MLKPTNRTFRVRRLLETRFGGVGYAPYGAFADIARDLDEPLQYIYSQAHRIGIESRGRDDIPTCDFWIVAFSRRYVRRRT